MTFTGLMRRLVYAFWENHDLDIDTRRENQFGCSEPWQTRVQHVLERNQRILSLYLLFHIIFHVQVWWSVEESGYPKSVPFISYYKIFQAAKTFSFCLKNQVSQLMDWLTWGWYITWSSLLCKLINGRENRAANILFWNSYTLSLCMQHYFLL